MSVIELPSGGWRLQIRRRKLKVDEIFPTQKAAREAQEKYVKASNAEDGVPTLLNAWATYKESPGYLQKRERTQGTEASRIKRLLQKFGHKCLTDISSIDVEDYISSRLKEQPKPSSDAIRLEVAALSALLNFCRARAYIASNPCIGVKRPAAGIVPRRMSADEEGALIALLRHSNFRFRAAARLCLLVRETGARPGEWRHVTWTDIDTDNERVIFQKTKYRRQPRTVPLTKAALQLLNEHLVDVLSQLDYADKSNPMKNTLSELVFAVRGRQHQARPMHYTGALRDAKKKNLLPKSVRAHTGRHEFVSTLVESTDLDDARIMALVGHHSPASMEVYKHVRNVRFLPHLEGLEEMRRKQRVKSLAVTLGIPWQLIEQLLLNRREAAAADGTEDAGEELLYTTGLLEEVGGVADGLGQTPPERHSELARRLSTVRSWAKKKAPEPMQSEDALKSTMESTSIGERLNGTSSQQADSGTSSDDGDVADNSTASTAQSSTASKRGRR